MLYLESIVMDKFKSFKHNELFFNKGFTCVVGPNGSGKSNICDALLFGLGENSLRRLRANRLEFLINMSSKKNQSKGTTGKTYVKLEFNGDDRITVTRAARSDGKSLYRLNGKRMTRQEVLEILGRHGIRADETNTIAQGEINKYTELTPKERRELIDIASGIKEFEYKKNESLKELEKVSQRISESQILVNERLGFLNELSAEKEAAEKYMQFKTRLTALNYNILMSRKSEATSQNEQITREMAITDSKLNELSYKIEELKKKIEQMSMDRQALTKELSESTQRSGEKNAKLEAIKLELASTSSSIDNILSSISSNENDISMLNSEIQVSTEKINADKVDLSQLESQIKNASSELESLGGVNTASEALELNKKMKKIEQELYSINDLISNLQADLAVLRVSSKSNKDEIEKLNSEFEEKEKQKKEIESEAIKKQKDLDLIKEKINILNMKASDTNSTISEIDGKTLNLKEQRSFLRPNEMMERIVSKFGKTEGFYGKASELCSYDSKYAYAIEASAGSRFDYIVVDSIEVASTIIEYLKKNRFGRATFIPIKELEQRRENEKVPGATSLTTLIDFDKKFSKVFNYVFNNTYLIDSASQAKSFGIGKHRYVTISGELVEQSGIMSGGSATKRMSQIKIDAELKELSSLKQEKLSVLDSINKELYDTRKNEAYMEMELKDAKKQSSMLDYSLNGLRSTINSKSKESITIDSKISKAQSELETLDSKRVIYTKEINDSRERMAGLYGGTSTHGVDVSRVDGLRKDIEQLKIKRAGIEKELQLLTERIDQTTKQITEKKKTVKLLKEQQKDKEAKTSVLKKEKESIEAEIMNSSDSGKELYTRLNSLDSEIARLSVESGKLSVEMTTNDRILNELKIKRSQTETRINDISAELSAYTDVIAKIDSPIAEMERESNVLEVRLKELGNVNMKAPEIYEDKKKSVDEAKSRLDTLETERHAILKMIEEIESKKLQTFMVTLNDVAKNFSKLYNYIFPGKASIGLENPKDPFNSGLEISISTDKTTKLLGGMSGGEKALVSMILIFSIHMCKPSALYIFDEVDAALDKDNSKKLSLLIKEMSKSAQFVVVSHNDSLISNADAAIGVIKSEDESKAIGIEVASVPKR